MERPDPISATDKEWTTYIFHAPNPVGILREWWCHAPTNFFFIAERHTATDEILATYLPGEMDERIEAAQREGGSK